MRLSSLSSMTSTIRLPDAMPDVSRPTLLVVCDSHHCRFLNVGGHAIVEKETLSSSEPVFTDRQDSFGGRGGTAVGVGEKDQVESHRLKEFSNTVVKHLEGVVRSEKVEALHIAAPGKFLSSLKDHLSTALTKILVQTIDGNFAKEQPLALLVRFRPDLKAAVEKLRDQENYSPSNLPPKK